MMKRNALLVGSFVIVALVLSVIGVLWISDNTLFTRQQRAIVYYLGNVSGLYVGAPVTFRGVPVGVVDDVGIEVESATLKARIPVRLRLRPSSLRFINGPQPKEPVAIETAVKRGLRARLVAQSFVTGQKSVELDFLPETPATLVGHEGEPEIPAVAERFGALVDQLADLPLRDTFQEVRDTVRQLGGALQTVEKTLQGAQAMLDAASKEVAATGRESRATLQAATAAIRQLEASTAKTLDAVSVLAATSSGTVQELRPDLRATLAGAREAAESARLAMNRVAELTAPGAPLRSDLDGAVRDLAQAARGLRDWSELLEEKPNAVIFGNRRE